MPSDVPPPLAERISRMFKEQIDEWLTRRGLVVLGVAYLLIVIWKTGQNVRSRPEVEYVIDLIIYLAVVSVASLLYVVFPWANGEIKHTFLGQLLVLVIAVLKYLALFALLLYQDIGLCSSLQKRWKNK